MSNTPWLFEQHDRYLIRNMNCLPFANTSVHPRLLVGPVSPTVIGGVRVTLGYWWGPCHPGLLVGLVSPTVISGARVARLVFCSPTVISGARVARLVFLFCVLSLHGLYSTNYALEPWINLIIQMHGITATIFLPSFWTKPGKYIYDSGIDLSCFYDFPIGFWNCSDSVVSFYLQRRVLHLQRWHWRLNWMN